MINLTVSLPLPSTLPKPLHVSALQFPPPLATARLRFSDRERRGRRSSPLSAAYTEYSPPQYDEEVSDENEKMSAEKMKALLKGGEQVVSVMQEMIPLLEDMEVSMDEDVEPVAIQLVAQGVIGKRVDEMESGFMMAIDYMINQAKRDNDDQRKSLLEVIKQTVLDNLTKNALHKWKWWGFFVRQQKKIADTNCYGE